MKLHSPFISARLAPAVKIGNAVLSFSNGKFVIDFPDGTEHVISDFRFPACRNAFRTFGQTDENVLQEGFAAVCSFLSACAESRQYGLRHYGDEMKGENSDLFPSHVGEWAEMYSDEIQMLSFELQNNGDLIEE